MTGATAYRRRPCKQAQEPESFWRWAGQSTSAASSSAARTAEHLSRAGFAVRCDLPALRHDARQYDLRGAEGYARYNPNKVLIIQYDTPLSNHHVMLGSG